MARAPLLTLSGIGHAIGSQTLFSGLDLVIGEGERLCLVGRNGAGKSTLLRIVAGELGPEAGERVLRPGTRVALLAQEPEFAGHERLDTWIAEGLPPDRAEDRHRVAAALDEAGLDGSADPAVLSGGELRRAALARAFLGEPGLLLLDEPTNHLDLPAIETLERRLAAFPGALITISHDRAFLRRVARGCLWLDRGRVRRLDRGLDAFDDWAEAELAREAAETAKLDKRIREETRWSRQGITARRKRNQGRLRRLEEMRAERRRRVAPQGTAALAAGIGKASGKLVIEAEDISKRFGERVLLRKFSTRIQRGDRVGIVGPNGAGKTTLLGLLTGTTAPDSGRVRLGTGLEILRVEQSRASLDPESTPWQVLTGGGGDQVMVRGQPRHVVAYLEDFLFSPDQARTPVRTLSGGERNRLLLARELAKPANLLVLDEPTNDLDMETLDLLEEVLADHPGTVLLVSHDRDFLDRLVSSTILLDGRGGATEFAGVPESWHAAVPAPAAPARPARKTAPAAPPPSAGVRRMSHAERRELAEIEARIDATGREIALLERALADPDAWSREPEKCRLAATRLAACRLRLAAAEERWLDLESRREEAGG